MAWDGLNEPTTTTGVTAPKQAPEIDLPRLVEVRGDPDQRRMETAIITALDHHDTRRIQRETAAHEVQRLDDRRRKAADDQDETEAKAGKRTTMVRWALGALLGSGALGTGGAFLSTGDGDGKGSPVEEALSRERLDVRVSGNTTEVGKVEARVGALETSMGDHIEKQGEENEAAKLRGVRQEMMLKQLLRSQGGRPPPLTEEQKAVYQAVGIDTDDPLKPGSWLPAQDP